MVPAMSAARTFSTWLWSAVSALLLLVVAAHAVAPVTAEHGPTRGSAFSASTEEVSLKAAARMDVARELVQLDPALPLQPVAVAIATRVVPGRLDGVPLRRPAQVAADPALHPLSPRAPPFA